MVQSKILSIAIFFCVALLAKAPVFAQELRRILYGVSTSISHLPVWVGKDTGLFAKNGLNIEPVQIRGGALSTMTIMSGQAVLSGVGAGSVVAARVEGGDIVLLACPADLEPVYLIARPEIKSPSELKGKASGVTRLNSWIHFYLPRAISARSARVEWVPCWPSFWFALRYAYSRRCARSSTPYLTDPPSESRASLTCASL